MTHKINEIKDWISKASDNEMAYLMRFLKNEKLVSRHGLDAFELEHFNKLAKIFNRFRIKIPDINKAIKIIRPVFDNSIFTAYDLSTQPN